MARLRLLPRSGIGRAATVTSLFPLGSTPAQRLKEYKELLANGHLVDIAHAIIGVEAAVNGPVTSSGSAVRPIIGR